MRVGLCENISILIVFAETWSRLLNNGEDILKDRVAFVLKQSTDAYTGLPDQNKGVLF